MADRNPFMKTLHDELRTSVAGQGAGFGRAFQDANKGATGLNQGAATKLDQELRMAAADSPLANAMGAAMAMAQAGVLKGQMGNDLLSGDIGRRNAAFQAIGNMGPMGLQQMLQSQGVNKGVISQFMNAKGANMEQIVKGGIADQVRQFQGREVNEVITKTLADELTGGFDGNHRQRRAQATGAAGKLTQELNEIVKKDPSLLNDPAKMGELVTRLAGASGMKEDQVAGAVRGLQEHFASDPDKQRLGGLKNALAVNREDTLEAGMKAAGEAQKAVPGEGKAEAPAGAAAPDAAAANKGGGGMRISIAQLTLKADGSAELEAPGIGAQG